MEYLKARREVPSEFKERREVKWREKMTRKKGEMEVFILGCVWGNGNT